MSKAVIKLVSKQSCKVMQSSVRSSYLFLPISTIFCILPSWPAKQRQATLLTTVFPLTTMRRDTTNRWRSLVAGSYQMPLHWGYRCSRVRGAVLTDYHDNLRSPCVSCANVRHLVDFLRLYTWRFTPLYYRQGCNIIFFYHDMMQGNVENENAALFSDSLSVLLNCELWTALFASPPLLGHYLLALYCSHACI